MCAAKRDVGEPLRAEEVIRAKVRIASLNVRVDAGDGDFRLDRGVLRFGFVDVEGRLQLAKTPLYRCNHEMLDCKFGDRMHWIGCPCARFAGSFRCHLFLLARRQLSAALTSSKLLYASELTSVKQLIFGKM